MKPVITPAKYKTTPQPGTLTRAPLGRGGPVKKGLALVIPKPINLPSRRAENNGFDPSIQLVAGGTWGGSAAAGKPAQSAPESAPQEPASTGPSRAPWADSAAPKTGLSADSDKSNFPRLGDSAPGPAPAWSKPSIGSVAARSQPDLGPHVPRYGGAPERRISDSKADLWGEDDEDEMDFNKPIVISPTTTPNKDEEVSGSSQASRAVGQPARPTPVVEIDLIEEAKIMARKKQQQLEKMQEQMMEQQRKSDQMAMERLAQKERMEEVARKDDEAMTYAYQQEQRRHMMEERSAREEKRKHAWTEERMRHEERERQYRLEAQRLDEARVEKQKELEIIQKQGSVMKQSMEASWTRRQQEEQQAEEERILRLENKLKELDAKQQQREVEMVKERHEMEDTARRLALERERMCNDSSRWQQQEPSYKDQRGPGHNAVESPHNSAWQTHARDNVRDARDMDQEPNSRVFAGWGRDRPGDAGQHGPRKLYDHKLDKYVVEGDQESGQPKKPMDRDAARESAERSRKEREARFQAEKESKETKSRLLEEAKLLEHRNRAALKIAALEERRRREKERGEEDAERDGSMPQKVVLLHKTKPAQGAVASGRQVQSQQNTDSSKAGGQLNEVLTIVKSDRVMDDPVFTLSGEWITQCTSSSNVPALHVMPQDKDPWGPVSTSFDTWSAVKPTPVAPWAAAAEARPQSKTNLNQIMMEEKMSELQPHTQLQQQASAVAPIGTGRDRGRGQTVRGGRGGAVRAGRGQEENKPMDAGLQQIADSTDYSRMPDFGDVATGAADFILEGDDEPTLEQQFAAAPNNTLSWSNDPVLPTDSNWAQGSWSSQGAASWDGQKQQPVNAHYTTAFAPSSSDAQFARNTGFNATPIGLHFIPISQQQVWSNTGSFPNSQIAGAFGPVLVASDPSSEWSSVPNWSQPAPAADSSMFQQVSALQPMQHYNGQAGIVQQADERFQNQQGQQYLPRQDRFARKTYDKRDPRAEQGDDTHSKSQGQAGGRGGRGGRRGEIVNSRNTEGEMDADGEAPTTRQSCARGRGGGAGASAGSADGQRFFVPKHKREAADAKNAAKDKT